MLEALALGDEIFDEDLFAYFEDVDLDWRAQQRGFRCRYTPSARGAHIRGGTGAASDARVAALVVSNRLLVMLKNDELAHVVRDWRPIVVRTLRDLGRCARRYPRALPIAAARVARLALPMWRKRRIVKRTRRRTAADIRRLLTDTAFLG
jgi:GT2 family glycosyltransferase